MKTKKLPERFKSSQGKIIVNLQGLPDLEGFFEAVFQSHRAFRQAQWSSESYFKVIERSRDALEFFSNLGKINILILKL